VPDRRRILTARISDDARTAIEAYCLEHGVTVTAWIEALGMRLADLMATPSDHEALRSVSAETVRVARQIDISRRARSPRDAPTSTGG
jgi:hypothetical protein